eukprot:526625-Rhodomonas_salina.6
MSASASVSSGSSIAHVLQLSKPRAVCVFGAQAYFSGIYIEHKVNKFSKQIFGQEEKNGFLGIGRKKKQPG